MRLLPRLLILAGLAYLCVILFREGQRIDAQPTADHSKLFLIFGGALICAVLAGIIAALTWLPSLGEKIGELIYGAADDVVHDPMILAHGKIAEGDYLEAISLYRQALIADPTDTAALGEIADVQTKYLGDPDAAAEMLEKSLEQHWPPDEESFLRCKLAEVYGRHQGDMTRARQLLLETIDAFPDTVPARNAQRLLLELESS